MLMKFILFQAKKRKFDISYGKDGNCYSERYAGQKVKLEGFPMCWVADIMSNFFIARKSQNGFKKIAIFSSTRIFENFKNDLNIRLR